MSSGLLQLYKVAKLAKSRGRFGALLFKLIRSASDDNGCRNIPLEDFYRKVVSYYPIDEGFRYLVRFSPVDTKGRSLGREGQVHVLTYVVLNGLKEHGWEVLTQDDERYEHIYRPDLFIDTRFLYVPQSSLCHTVVVQRRRKVTNKTLADKDSSG